MKKANPILIIASILLVIWNNYYPTWIIAGIYVSNNNGPVLEGPSSIDTLALFENGTFKNGAWGEGTYEIEGNEIDFTYEYSMGKAGYRTHIDRSLFIWKPRISLNTDLQYYYKKK